MDAVATLVATPIREQFLSEATTLQNIRSLRQKCESGTLAHFGAGHAGRGNISRTSIHTMDQHTYTWIQDLYGNVSCVCDFAMLHVNILFMEQGQHGTLEIYGLDLTT